MQLKAIWTLWTLSLLAGQPAFSQPTPSNLQQQAEDALVSDQPAETVRLAIQMLDAHPNSCIALYLLALGQAELGAQQAAAVTSAKAYDVATTEGARFQAARLVAGTRFQARQYTRAEFWLRRAANHAQTEEESRSVASAYRASIDANPLSLQFSAYVAPSDNVNNGSDDGVLTLEGIGLTFILPEDRRSLSGVAFSASSEARYRIWEGPQHATYLTGSLAGETYVLSSEAQDLLASSPNPAVRAVEGSDFATVTAALGFNHQQNNISTFGPVRFGMNFGTYWESGERLVDFRDLNIEQIIPIGQNSVVNLRAAQRDQTALLPSILDSTTNDIAVSYSRLLANNDQIQFSILARDKDAGFESSFEEYQLGVGYALAEPIWGVQLSSSLQLGFRTFEEFTTTLDGRDDRFASADVTATFQDISYFGFSPSLSVFVSRTDSTAEEISFSSVQVLFGIESNF